MHSLLPSATNAPTTSMGPLAWDFPTSSTLPGRRLSIWWEWPMWAAHSYTCCMYAHKIQTPQIHGIVPHGSLWAEAWFVCLFKCKYTFHAGMNLDWLWFTDFSSSKKQIFASKPLLWPFFWWLIQAEANFYSSSAMLEDQCCQSHSVYVENALKKFNIWLSSLQFYVPKSHLI